MTDGKARRAVPFDAIATVAAAGNYVELRVGDRTMLHRATLAATADLLGDRFVRVRRGLLVRTDAIGAVAVDRSGDFIAPLADGTTVRGSRRHRDGLRRWTGGSSRNEPT